MSDSYYRQNRTQDEITSDVYRFANTITYGMPGTTKEYGEELKFKICPYCHGESKKGGNINTWKFSINKRTGQFECKRGGCGAKGNLITLARDFDQFDLGRDVNIYYKINNGNGSFKKFNDAHKAIEVRDAAIEFLKKRGISEEITRKYEVTTMDYYNQHCVVFPFKDETGEMVFYKVRKVDGTEFNGDGKERTVKGNYKKILFGMNQCKDFGTLVITEGQIDSLSCAEAGIPNAVSVPNGKNCFTWKPNVWNWLLKFEEIVVFGDNENGEVSLAKEISQFYPKPVRIVRIEDYRGYKDANELLTKEGPDALKNAVNNAEAKISFRIKDLAKVDNVNLDKLKSYPTGFKSIDDAIGHGFHDGELIILTGKCGEGKSTFASQIVAKMLKNGLKCFCYSGELPDYMFKAWLDKQITGGYMSNRARSTAEDFYKKRCFIFDNSSVVDEKEAIFEVMAEAVKYLGCKFILIDNLMTAMEDKPSEDLFRQQSKFVTDLTKFAKSYNAIIMLVAHPKKGNDDSNDAISGSGDITNRANIVLRYQRRKSEDPPVKCRKCKYKDYAEELERKLLKLAPPEPTPNDNKSLLKITKNRTTGKLSDGIDVIYDPDSMRIREDGYEFESFLEISEDDKFQDIEEFDDLDVIPF